jgi:TonB family C-terminal domain
MYVALSVIAHAVILGGMFLFESITAPPKVETVSIDFITPEQAQQLTNLAEAQKKKQVMDLPANQIVEQDENSVNEEEVNTRFLSAKNQKVKKQTVAVQKGQFQNQKKAATTQAGKKGDGREKALDQAQSDALAKDLFKNFDANEALERQKQAARIQQGEGLGKAEYDSDQANAKGGDVSQNNDYIKDVDQGLETLLNTREFKYYSYYNRIRRQLSQHWEGKVREKLSKLFREGRAPAATGTDRITKVVVVLNEKGTLVRVQVLSDSGVRDLDDAAIEAFRAAAPFPNPPQGIIEGDGTVKIRWDFVLET